MVVAVRLVVVVRVEERVAAAMTVEVREVKAVADSVALEARDCAQSLPARGCAPSQVHGCAACWARDCECLTAVAMMEAGCPYSQVRGCAACSARDCGCLKRSSGDTADTDCSPLWIERPLNSSHCSHCS